MEVILCCLLTAFVFCIGFYFFHKYLSKKIVSLSEEALIKCRELEKAIHTNEVDFLEEKNQREISHQETLKAAKESAYNEGFSVGKIDGEKDYKIELLKLRTELNEKMSIEKEASAKSARELLRAELESQVKLFSISIHPYIKIVKDEGFFSKSYKSHVGYQYQLLINGVPAFQPHVVIENSQEFKQFDQSIKKELVSIASTAAKDAAALYLSGAPPSVLKMGHEIFAEEKAD